MLLTACELHLSVSALGPPLPPPAILGLVITIKEAAGWPGSPTAPADPVLPKIGVCACGWVGVHALYLSGQKIAGNAATSHNVEHPD